MNRGTVVGWTALAALLLVLGFSAGRIGRAVTAPPQTAQVMAYTCEVDETYTDASVAIRNTSETPIAYAKAYFRIGDAIEDRYLRPLELPPGAIGTADTGRRGRHGCQLLGIQDENGREVVLSN
jgi:hypothetical protein